MAEPAGEGASAPALKVVEEVFENQRYNPIRGWAKPFSTDGNFQAFSDLTGETVISAECGALPDLSAPEGWAWEGEWALDGQLGDGEGWCYATTFAALKEQLLSGATSSQKSATDFVRRRRWTRTRRAMDDEAGAAARKEWTDFVAHLRGRVDALERCMRRREASFTAARSFEKQLGASVRSVYRDADSDISDVMKKLSGIFDLLVGLHALLTALSDNDRRSASALLLTLPAAADAAADAAAPPAAPEGAHGKAPRGEAAAEGSVLRSEKLWASIGGASAVAAQRQLCVELQARATSGAALAGAAGVLIDEVRETARLCGEARMAMRRRFKDAMDDCASSLSNLCAAYDAVSAAGAAEVQRWREALLSASASGVAPRASLEDERDGASHVRSAAKSDLLHAERNYFRSCEAAVDGCAALSAVARLLERFCDLCTASDAMEARCRRHLTEGQRHFFATALELYGGSAAESAASTAAAAPQGAAEGGAGRAEASAAAADAVLARSDRYAVDAILAAMPIAPQKSALVAFSAPAKRLSLAKGPDAEAAPRLAADPVLAVVTVDGFLHLFPAEDAAESPRRASEGAAAADGAPSNEETPPAADSGAAPTPPAGSSAAPGEEAGEGAPAPQKEPAGAPEAPASAAALRRPPLLSLDVRRSLRGALVGASELAEGALRVRGGVARDLIRGAAFVDVVLGGWRDESAAEELRRAVENPLRIFGVADEAPSRPRVSSVAAARAGAGGSEEGPAMGLPAPPAAGSAGAEAVAPSEETPMAEEPIGGAAEEEGAAAEAEESLMSEFLDMLKSDDDVDAELLAALSTGPAEVSSTEQAEAAV